MNWIQRRYWYHKLRNSPYQHLFASVHKGEYVSLDCETTSLDPKRAELVTIAATKIIDNRINKQRVFTGAGSWRNLTAPGKITFAKWNR